MSSYLRPEQQMSIEDLHCATTNYRSRKEKHNLQTIQPRVAALFNKYRDKKKVFLTEEEWNAGKKNNAEKYRKDGDVLTIVLDKDHQPIWQSHK